MLAFSCIMAVVLSMNTFVQSLKVEVKIYGVPEGYPLERLDEFENLPFFQHFSIVDSGCGEGGGYFISWENLQVDGQAIQLISGSSSKAFKRYTLKTSSSHNKRRSFFKTSDSCKRATRSVFDAARNSGFQQITYKGDESKYKIKITDSEGKESEQTVKEKPSNLVDILSSCEKHFGRRKYYFDEGEKKWKKKDGEKLRIANAAAFFKNQGDEWAAGFLDPVLGVDCRWLVEAVLQPYQITQTEPPEEGGGEVEVVYQHLLGYLFTDPNGLRYFAQWYDLSEGEQALEYYNSFMEGQGESEEMDSIAGSNSTLVGSFSSVIQETGEPGDDTVSLFGGDDGDNETEVVNTWWDYLERGGRVEDLSEGGACGWDSHVSSGWEYH